MKVPIIPGHLLKYGIKPKQWELEKLYPDSRSGFHLAGFDVETVGGSLFRKNDLYTAQIVMDDEKNSHIFFPERQGIENLEMFFECAGGHAKRIYATAHNASFDIGALLGKDVFPLMQGIETGGWEGKIVDGNSCFATLRHRPTGRMLTISDSMAWFKGSLKNVAKTYFTEELQKNERPEYLGLRTPKNKEEFDKFVAYAEQDALIQLNLTKMIYGLCKEGNVKMCLTPAQLSGRVFQKHYMKERIFLPNWRLLELIARTYHGAQFTAFGRGFFEKVFYYDINSLYPYAAINVPLNFSNTELEPLTLEKIEQGYCGFLGCKFDFGEGEKYPCLPQYRELEGAWKLVFPRRGISYTTTEELKLALKKGCDVPKILGYGWYPEQQDINHPLGDYMNDIYAKKKELDDIKEKRELTHSEGNSRQYYKLLLNSLIGKFCQRNKIWLEDIEVAGSLFKPDYASLILSKSRAIINQMISKNGAIYSDTDCLMTKHSLPTGTKMGELKNELGGNSRGDLLSIRSKLYFITNNEEIIKCAKHGFRQPGKEVFEELLKKRSATMVRYSTNRLTRLKESYRRKCLPRRKINQMFTISLRDDNKRQYDKPLETVEELLTCHTDSRPIDSMSFEVHPA